MAQTPNATGRKGLFLALAGVAFSLSGAAIVLVCCVVGGSGVAFELVRLLEVCGFLLTVVAVIYSAVGMRQRPRGRAIAGLATSALWLVVIVVVMITVVLPSIRRDRERLRRDVSATSLNIIGKGLVLYTHTYDGVYPQDLRLLVKGGSVGHEGLFYPGRAGDPRASYFYLPPVGTDRSDTIVACERIGCSKGGRNCLTVGNAVRWVTEAEFQAELDKPQNARFAAALRGAEPAASR